jgi:uncharacterized protein
MSNEQPEPGNDHAFELAHAPRTVPGEDAGKAGRGVLTALIMAALYTAGMAVTWQVTEANYDDTAALVRESIPALVVLVLLVLAVVKISGLRVQGKPRVDWWLIGPMVLMLGPAIGLLPSLITTEDLDWKLVVAVLVGTILVGMGEEGAYRGVVLNGLGQRFSPAVSVALSSVLFGLMHSVNVMAGLTLDAAISQVIFTSILGLILGWTYLISNRNLGLVIAMHALYDFGVIAADAVPGYEATVPWLLLIPILGIALSIVGPRKMAGRRVAEIGA